jgi:hypothetical protein
MRRHHIRPMAYKERYRKPKPQAIRTSLCTRQSDNALKVHYSATLGQEEPEIEEVALV